MKKRVKLAVLSILSFVISVVPLASIILINTDKYFVNIAAGVKLAAGGMIVIVLMLLNAFGRLKIPGGVMAYLIVFLLAYLLEAVLKDLMLISGAALLGAALDHIFIRPLVKKAREDILVGKTADATADKVKAVLDEYLGGRV